jgi:4-amino-4-deoxy-L-arabinose transferase-like glycosyltransferase
VTNHVGLQTKRSFNSLQIFWVGALVISIFGVIFQLVNLRLNLIDLFSFRQTHTAMSIGEFKNGNWSLATPFTSLGPTWQMAYEFPLFQSIAAIIGTVFRLDVDTAARISGLFSFVLAGVLLAVLIRRWFGSVAALVTLVFFQSMPFGVQWASSSLIEFTAISCVLGSILAVDIAYQKFNWTLLLVATILLGLASAVKGTTTVAWAIVFLIAGTGLMWRNRPQIKLVVTTSLSLLVGLGIGLIWTAYADMTKMENPVAKYLTSEALFQWTYGTLGQRTELGQWERIFERLPSLGASLWVFVVVLVIALWRLKFDLRLVALASVPVIAVITFFNLYVVHSYYLSAVYPAYVAILGIGVAAISRLVSHRNASLLVAGTLSVLLIILAWTSTEGRYLKSLIGVEGKFPEISRVIAESTPEDAGVIVVGCDWDPTPLFYAERRGMTIPSWYRDGIPSEWIGTELKYLVFCGEDFSLVDGDPNTVLPTGSLIKADESGIYQVFGPDVVTRILNWSVVP